MIMTRQRKFILSKMSEAALCWGYEERGGKFYFFSDGTPVIQRVIEGLIKLGALRTDLWSQAVRYVE